MTLPCTQSESIKEIKGDIRELKRDVSNIKGQNVGFAKDIESLIKQLASLTSWLKWLIVTLAGAIIVGGVALGYDLVKVVLVKVITGGP